MTGFETFAAFIPELKPLLDDESVSEVEVNSASTVFAERSGVRKMENITLQESGLKTACELIAQRISGVELSPENPIVDSRLSDGSRVAICVPPVSVDGITLTIRKHQRRYFTLESLVAAGMMSSELAEFLRSAVVEKRNLLISGATSSGKTTLARALGACIPAEQRVIIIEDTTEIEIPHENQRRFEAQPGIATVQQILRATLRHGPDRIILGEVRGPEAYDLMQLLNTGHSGSLSTIHASSATLALRRFSSCVMQAGIDIPYRAIRSDIADSINLLIHLERKDGVRSVREVLEVHGYDAENDRYELQEVTPLPALSAAT
jgi:pilus assembly protein CpaF